ncbi:nucleotidyl transferase AbiEii/AbiGii toxin family protein [bacterium]|nr:nucleotidyl transferase AbiEii/AbiGii toxin family protein [bacterium]
MTFPHQHTDFEILVMHIARSRALSNGLIEKDYWITHTLWALHRTDLDIWFKGGTSLSKAYHLIERFSEDVDLRMEPGRAGVPPVPSWKSTNPGRIAARRGFYEALENVMAVPDASVALMPDSIDKDARGAVYHVEYPGQFQRDLGDLSPYVMLEVGAARVTPFVRCTISSFVHDELMRLGQLDDFIDNRPVDVRCVHPLVTLIEKLDAVSRRFRREPMDPASFIRHYEDAASIILNYPDLPPLDESASALIDDLLREKQIRWRPDANDAAFNLRAKKNADVFAAYDAIAPMYWGKRIPLARCCALIREWLKTNA